MSKNTPNPNNLPENSLMIGQRQEGVVDLIELAGFIVEFVEYIRKPEIIEMQSVNSAVYIQHLESRFEKFTLEYYKIFRTLIDYPDELDTNIEGLTGYIKRLYACNGDRRKEEKETKLMNMEIAEKHLYPSFGGQDAYEKYIQDQQMGTNSGIKKHKKNKKH